MKDQLITEPEYAALVKRSLASVRRDRRQGKGPRHVRVGGVIRYRVSDIEAFLSRNSSAQ